MQADGVWHRWGGASHLEVFEHSILEDEKPGAPRKIDKLEEDAHDDLGEAESKYEEIVKGPVGQYGIANLDTDLT